MNLALQQEVRHLKESGQATLTFPLFLGTPLPHQPVAAEIAFLTKRLFLMDPVGLGKTVISLLLVSKLLEDVRAGRRPRARVLLCVENDCLHQWKGEIRRFLGLDALTLPSEKSARHKRYDLYASRDEAVLLLNHSKLFVDFDKLATRFKPDLLVIDEAAIVSNQNKTHQFAAWLARLTEYVLLMSAEPLSRGDLVQVRNGFLVLGIELCKDEQEFVDKFVVVEERKVYVRGSNGPFKKTIRTPKGAKNLAEFKNLIYYNALRRPETVLGERRILNRQLVSVPMTPLMRERYAEVKAKILTQKHERRELNAVSTAGYLSQILCSPYIPDPTAKKECPKGEALARLCKKIAPEKIVVFAKWKAMHELLATIFRAEGISALFYSGDLNVGTERHETLDKFRDDPAVQVLVMTQAGQRGLNLQVARNLAIVDLLHSPAAMRQIVGRIDRIGQQARVLNFYIFVAEDSSEMGILKVLQERQAVIDKVFDEERADMFDASFSPEELLLNV